ncbi:MAG: hypothetical protein IKK17_07155 [Oscillospiraceae bacterium]|nr:hypothetical protein [Oscillospiraceae bacterium]
MKKKILILIAIMTIMTGCNKNENIDETKDIQSSEVPEVSHMPTLTPTAEPHYELVNDENVMNEGDLPILIGGGSSIQLPSPTPTSVVTLAPVIEPTPAPVVEPTPSPVVETTPGADDGLEEELGGLPIL